MATQKQQKLIGLDSSIARFVEQKETNKKFEDLILSREVIGTCEDLITEHDMVEQLKAYNLAPSHKILLIGLPGNGKTSLAAAIASKLTLPLLSLSYANIIGAYLGETANRLSKILGWVATQRCVLLIDEFEVLGSERTNKESGEMARITASLLLEIDKMPSNVIIIAATNHPELLDRAVKRRFQVYLKLPPPGLPEIEKYIANFEKRIELDIARDRSSLAKRLTGLSFAEIENLLVSAYRKWVISSGKVSIRVAMAGLLTPDKPVIDHPYLG